MRQDGRPVLCADAGHPSQPRWLDDDEVGSLAWLGAGVSRGGSISEQSPTGSLLAIIMDPWRTPFCGSCIPYVRGPPSCYWVQPQFPWARYCLAGRQGVGKRESGDLSGLHGGLCSSQRIRYPPRQRLWPTAVSRIQRSHVPRRQCLTPPHQKWGDTAGSLLTDTRLARSLRRHRSMMSVS